MKLKDIVIAALIFCAFIGIFGGLIVQNEDQIIERTPDCIYVKKYSWYNLDSTVHKYKTDKIYKGVVSGKYTRRRFVGIPGKGGHFVTRLFVTIKIDNGELVKHNHTLYNKYEEGDTVTFKETYYPCRSTQVLRH